MEVINPAIQSLAYTRIQLFIALDVTTLSRNLQPTIDTLLVSLFSHQVISDKAISYEKWEGNELQNQEQTSECLVTKQ